MKILKTMYIPFTLIFISCSTSPVYRSESTLQGGVQKICGQAFCTETDIQEGVGGIHIKTTESDGMINPELIDLEAHCHGSSARALHLRTHKLSTETIPLIQREDHWEFSSKALQKGCRFELIVYTKKVQEKFTFQPRREYIR
jgi:hypothetical protein